MTRHDTKTVATNTGVFVHERVTTAPQPEHRPPPASRLPSWVINAKDICIDEDCADRIEGFAHRHVRGFPLAEHVRVSG